MCYAHTSAKRGSGACLGPTAQRILSQNLAKTFFVLAKTDFGLS